MHPANKVIKEVQEKYGEWLEHDKDREVLTGILSALLAKERQKSENYEMALKRRELMR